MMMSPNLSSRLSSPSWSSALNVSRLLGSMLHRDLTSLYEGVFSSRVQEIQGSLGVRGGASGSDLYGSLQLFHCDTLYIDVLIVEELESL